MKIETKEATVTSDVPQENVTKMSISLDGMEHIMSLLTNLYKDPDLAVIREYFTNAVDAHVAAGQTKPVEITLPTWDAPVYVVKDYGIGMTKDDIQNVYAQYGASTKRNTNDQVGAFGLGCKSALTIATQFTVVSVKDGWKATALFSKEESGGYSANVVSHVQTTEENGTTVKIPVNDVYRFTSRCASFFKFATPGIVLVDGSQPKYALEKATAITNEADPDYLGYTTEDSYGDSYLIMGNVPYALSSSEVESSVARLGMGTETSRYFLDLPKYFPVKIGDVDLTPSREGLRFTDKTNAVVDYLIEGFIKHVSASAQEEIDAVTDFSTLATVVKKWKRILGGTTLLWKGQDIPEFIKTDKAVRKIVRSSWNGSSHTLQNGVDPFPAKNTFLISGSTAEKFSKVNSYFTPFMASRGISSATFLITDEASLFTNEWVLKNSNFIVITDEEVINEGREQRKADRLANKTVTKVAGVKLEYPVLNIDSGVVDRVSYDKIPANTPYLWKGALRENSDVYSLMKDLHSPHGSTRWAEKYAKALAENVKKISKIKFLILLGGSRSPEALVDRVPTTVDFKKEVQKLVDGFHSKIPEPVTVFASKRNSSWFGLLNRIGLTSVLDDVADKNLAKLMVPDESIIKTHDELVLEAMAINGMGISGISPLSLNNWSVMEEVSKKMLKKYPLLDAIRYNVDEVPRDHVLLYMNTVHELEELAVV